MGVTTKRRRPAPPPTPFKCRRLPPHTLDLSNHLSTILKMFATLSAAPAVAVANVQQSNTFKVRPRPSPPSCPPFPALDSH